MYKCIYHESVSVLLYDNMSKTVHIKFKRGGLKNFKYHFEATEKKGKFDDDITLIESDHIEAIPEAGEVSKDDINDFVKCYKTAKEKSTKRKNVKLVKEIENPKVEVLNKSLTSNLTIGSSTDILKKLKPGDKKLVQVKHRVTSVSASKSLEPSKKSKEKRQKTPKVEKLEINTKSSQSISNLEVEKLKREILKLNTENEILTLKNNSIEKKIAALERSQVKLTEQSEKSRRDYNELLEDRERMKKKITMLTDVQTKIERINNINENLLSENKKLKGEREETASLLLEKNNRINDLDKKVFVLVERNKKYLIAYKKNREGEKKHDLMKLQVGQLKNKLILKDKEITVLEEIISSKESEITQLSKGVESYLSETPINKKEKPDNPKLDCHKEEELDSHMVEKLVLDQQRFLQSLSLISISKMIEGEDKKKREDRKKFRKAE